MKLKCDECGKEYQIENGELKSLKCDCGGQLCKKRIIAKPKFSKRPGKPGKFIARWNKLGIVPTIVIGALFMCICIVALIVCAYYNVGEYNPTPEELLIKNYQSGKSPADLMNEIKYLDDMGKETIESQYNNDVKEVKQQFTDGSINEAEKNSKLDYHYKNYQKSLTDLESIRTYKIAYIEGKITAEELKKSTTPLYQQTPYLKFFYDLLMYYSD